MNADRKEGHTLVLAVALLLLTAVLAPASRAQEEPAPPPGGPRVSKRFEKSARVDPADVAAAKIAATPAELPMDPAEATAVYLARMTPEERERSDAYFEGGYVLQAVGLLVTLAVCAVWLWGGWAAALRSRLEGDGKLRYLKDGAFIVLFMLGTSALQFPLTVYQGFVREHRYGLSTQGGGDWFGQWALGTVISAVMMGLLLPLVFVVIRKFARTWWLWGAGVMFVFSLAGIFLSPVLLDPLFNKYEPLPPGEIRTAIEELAKENHIPVDRIEGMDASRQSKRISAHVTGIGSTAAIRLNDNLLHRTSLPEIRAVMAHEMGHYVLHHIWKGMGQALVLSVLLFALVAWVAPRLIARHASWGLTGVGDVAALPLFLAILAIALALLTPLNNTLSRNAEADADRFGLDAAKEPIGFAEVLLKLSEYRKMDPSPLEEFIFYDHPSGRARIRMAMEWRAAHAKGASDE